MHHAAEVFLRPELQRLSGLSVCTPIRMIIEISVCLTPESA
jgi:hypothetical protein